ncbi:MAG: endonuclease/exonuclease/phosphatase family protein [Ferruginibacter sp.]|nr:endonuclease/exonuclease/phosphatase family protein [Ferruginibacter sp.]
MKKRIFLITITLLIFYVYANAQISICCWNLENFGKSKSDEVIAFIANTIKGFDVICILEVVAGDGGAPAVAKLTDLLNRKGALWEYTISDPTVSSSYKTERYAYIWKTSKVKKKGNAWLEKKYNLLIDREPYFIDFDSNGGPFTLVAFHAITKSKQPETEIKYFRFLPLEYPRKNLIFAGDYNCPQSHTVFNPLKKMGYKPIFKGQRTSLKQECTTSDCLASEFDNIFYDSAKINCIQSGIIPFYESFPNLKEARKVSDHVPIYFKFSLK